MDVFQLDCSLAFIGGLASNITLSVHSAFQNNLMHTCQRRTGFAQVHDTAQSLCVVQVSHGSERCQQSDCHYAWICAAHAAYPLLRDCRTGMF